MTSVAVLSACSMMNAFCISEVQHKTKRGRIGFHSEFAPHTHIHTRTQQLNTGGGHNRQTSVQLNGLHYPVLHYIILLFSGWG